MPTIDQRSRRRFLATFGTCVGGALAGCVGSSNPSSNDSSASSNVQSDWPTVGHDQANSRYSPTGTAPIEKPTITWRLPIETPVRQPVFANDRVYMADRTVLRVHDVATGDELWTYSSATSDGQMITAPTVRDGVVYLGITNGPQSVVALDEETGEQLWTFGGKEIGGVSGTPTLDTSGNRLYLGTRAAQIFALDAKTGESHWQQDVFGPVTNTLAVRSPFIIATTRSGEVYSFGEDGKGLWRTKLPEGCDSPPALSNRWVFVGCNNEYVYGLHPVSGRIKWETYVDRLYQGGFVATTSTVYVTSSRGVVALGGRKGSTQWSTKLGDFVSCAPTIIDETLYVGGPRIFALASSGGVGISSVRFGTKRWTADVGRHVGPGMAVGNGRIFAPVQADDGTFELIALKQ